MLKKIKSFIRQIKIALWMRSDERVSTIVKMVRAALMHPEGAFMTFHRATRTMELEVTGAAELGITGMPQGMRVIIANGVASLYDAQLEKTIVLSPSESRHLIQATTEWMDEASGARMAFV